MAKFIQLRRDGTAEKIWVEVGDIARFGDGYLRVKTPSCNGTTFLKVIETADKISNLMRKR